MDNQVVGKVLEYIENVGTAVSNGATYGFELLVKQQFVEGIVWTGFNLMWLIITIILVRSFFKRFKEVEYCKEDDVQLWILGISSGIFIVGSLVNILCMPENIMSIFNPEYYAIKEIMDIFKPSN